MSVDALITEIVAAGLCFALRLEPSPAGPIYQAYVWNADREGSHVDFAETPIEALSEAFRRCTTYGVRTIEGTVTGLDTLGLVCVDLDDGVTGNFHPDILHPCVAPDEAVEAGDAQEDHQSIGSHESWDDDDDRWGAE